MSVDIKDYRPSNEWVYRDEPSLIEVFRKWCSEHKCAKCPAKGGNGIEGACYLAWKDLPAEESVIKAMGLV